MAQRFLVLVLAILVSACAPQAGRLANATPLNHAGREQVWGIENSDVPIDPAWRLGRLDNGMRFIIRPNATPKGTAIVRMEVAAGSLDESDAERGYAHFVEHMAFNGSTNVPEGEMVRLLERDGLAFGADTNASTGFETTTYKLDLPRNDPALLDTALMLMRETASELTISADAVARERGVVLAEMRDRNDWQFRNAIADTKFMHPQALYPERFAIGTAETLNAATSASLRAFWSREYVPAHTTVVVIGDFDPAVVETAIRARFAGWSGPPGEKQPSPGPIVANDGGRTQIWIDPAQANRITAERHGKWLDEPDTVANRREMTLRMVGYGAINRRLDRLANSGEPPFRGAGFGTGALFEAGRATRLIVDVVEKKWKGGLDAAVREYRAAMKYGFSKTEIAEQLANMRKALADNAASADTRSHRVHETMAFGLLRERQVPSHPAEGLKRFDAFAPKITPKQVMQALKREALPLTDPLLRYRGRDAIPGGERELRVAWDKAYRAPLARGKASEGGAFAYTEFGPPGAVASDSVHPELGIRTLRFANGVMLNLKRTDIDKDRVLVSVDVDGGDRLSTTDNPLAVAMTRNFADGGLGKHSDDELQSILAGRTVQSDMAASADAFAWSARTTPADLALQLQLFAAYLRDPGYRREGEVKYWHFINNWFAQRNATPGAAIGAAMGGILSDNDPRFSLADIERYRALTFAKLRKDMADRLANGAIEVALVGDIDEATAIDLVARTFGALPPREPGFSSFAGQPPRRFTADRTPRTVTHTGPADQAQLVLVWPTRDDSDPIESMGLAVLERVVRIELTETLREKLGKAYSPGASSQLSRLWQGYGTFTIAASVDVADLPATRSAIAEALAELRARPVDADVLQRARQPMLEAHDNALKGNGVWMTLAERAQSLPDRLARFLSTRSRLTAVTPEALTALARRYLTADGAVEVVAMPQARPQAPAATAPPLTTEQK